MIIINFRLTYLKGDIAAMLRTDAEKINSGIIGARILLGISSPAHPASHYYHQKYWGQYPFVDFHKLVKLINQHLVQHSMANRV